MQRVTTVMVDGRESHTRFAEFILGCICKAKKKAIVIDVDAIYASHNRIFTSQLARECLENITLWIPADNSIQALLTSTAFSSYEVLLIDDLNTIYHILSLQDGSGIQRLVSMSKMLSYFCRENRTAVILTVYSSTERFARIGQRSLFRIGDLSVSMKFRDSEIQFTCNHGNAWKNNSFSAKV
jgi:hypothetical protein